MQHSVRERYGSQGDISIEEVDAVNTYTQSFGIEEGIAGLYRVLDIDAFEDGPVEESDFDVFNGNGCFSLC